MKAIRFLAVWLVAMICLSTSAYARNLKFGDKGKDVKLLQARLGVKQTGEFHQMTKSAVLAFQKKHGLPQTGVWGEMSQNALKKKLSSNKLATKASAKKTSSQASTSAAKKLNKPAVEAVGDTSKPARSATPQLKNKEKEKEPKGRTRVPLQYAEKKPETKPEPERKLSLCERIFGVKKTTAKQETPNHSKSGVVVTYASHFGYRDRDDNGRGSPYLGYAVGRGKCTNNKHVVGVALPESVLRRELDLPPLPRRNQFSSRQAWHDAIERTWHQWQRARDCTVDIICPRTGKVIVSKVDVLDLGPAKWVTESRNVEIDFTYALNKMIGGNGRTLVAYRLNKPKRTIYPSSPSRYLESSVRLASR